jgi:hypothetical protein
MNAPPKCESCGIATSEGFLLDHGYGVNVNVEWVEGKAEKNSWTGSIRGLRKRQRHPLTAYRCERCGRVSLFAGS